MLIIINYIFRGILMYKPLQKSMVAAAAFAAVIAPTFAAASEESINVYSYRQPFLIQPFVDAFKADTGINVNIVFAKKGFVEKIKAAKGKDSADLLLTVDIGRLVASLDADIAEPISSDILTANIPANLRDPDGKWFAISLRTRVIYASKERVAQDNITYEELADPKWKGKICIRSGQNLYNLGLFSSMIAHNGEEATQKWLEGLKANLARTPKGNDRAQAQGIFNGECDIAIANAYYMGKMITNEKNPEQKDWANSIKVLYPNVDGRGSHVNVSGVVVIKGSKNQANAIKFAEYLVSDKVQAMYAEANFERPVKPGVPVSDLVKSWGEFKGDSLPVSTVAKNLKRASELVDIVNFDN